VSREPVEVVAPDRATASVRIAVIIVTWNRKQVASDAIAAVSRQAFDLSCVDVLVIDNASEDGTLDALRERWSPERVVHNGTTRAHVPDFDAGAERLSPRSNKGGFRSLTIVRNRENMGGCGGFNTGFAAIERILGAGDREPDYVWLLDDDTDLPAGALPRLVRTAEGDPTIGLVGSRTVDIGDRQTTIETTIYFDPEQGTMGPEPAEGHPRAGAHRAWVERTGGTRGRGEFHGVRDVDVVSASSLLARWSAVKKVGLWDKRFFIYCDDADWSLRFARAGYRVVCDMDAVVYHVYWLAKLTPTRAYYSQRNLIWMLQKALDRPRRRGVLARRIGSTLRDSRKAASHARLIHAEAMRRAVLDATTNRGGRLDVEEPAFVPLAAAFGSCGVGEGSVVAVMCTREGMIEQAEAVRAQVESSGAGSIRSVRWIYFCPVHLAEAARIAGRLPSDSRIQIRRFEATRLSKWRSQRDLVLRPAAATIVFDNSNEFPFIRSRWNIHIDQRRAGQAQVEADGLGRRVAFMVRWGWTALLAGIHVLRDPGFERTDRYG
jgi:GT2 family glycosyltransferase